MNIFTSSGTFEIPKGVKEIECFAVGGGYYGLNNVGGGGGYTKTEKISVNPGNIISISIGVGGTCINYSAANPGNTLIDSIMASGGNGGNGGSGGGADQWANNGDPEGGGNGGSDGSNGSSVVCFGTVKSGGIGQGTTTRAFGESEGTLYAGGGGGGYTCTDANSARGAGSGGAGGGGNGGICAKRYWDSDRGTAVYSEAKGTPGQVNTGGGGGGIGWIRENGSPAAGGSGIAIIRWGY